MQFLITEEEMKTFKVGLEDSQDKQLLKDALVIARTAILDERGFRCIHEQDPTKYSKYCDDCPVSSLYKHSVEREEWKAICGQETRYSK